MHSTKEITDEVVSYTMVSTLRPIREPEDGGTHERHPAWYADEKGSASWKLYAIQKDDAVLEMPPVTVTYQQSSKESRENTHTLTLVSECGVHVKDGVYVKFVLMDEGAMILEHNPVDVMVKKGQRLRLSWSIVHDYGDTGDLPVKTASATVKVEVGPPPE